jgi:hypothetical protein
MAAERKITLPGPSQPGQSYLLSSEFITKLKEVDLGYFVKPNEEDFEIEKGGEELRFKLKKQGGTPISFYAFYEGEIKEIKLLRQEDSPST